MTENQTRDCDVFIAGGGLSGLALASVLAMQGVNVVVAEKEDYPRHRVCGEYIAAESLPFLHRIGFDPEVFSSSWITLFEAVFPNGNIHRCRLDPGGFGLSRFELDNALYKLAVNNGARVLTRTQVYGIAGGDPVEEIFRINTGAGEFRCRYAVASAGRAVAGLLGTRRPAGNAKRYFGVKYHVRMDFPRDLIRIALFDGGYCGMSAIEDDLFCFCYMADAAGLKKWHNDIGAFERHVLAGNPELKRVMQQMNKVNGPVTAANFQFGYHSTDHGPWVLAGDSAGFIPPLTGNGMSLAFRSAEILGTMLIRAMGEGWTHEQLQKEYRQYGLNYLKRRIKKGIFLQSLILNRTSSQNRFLSVMLSTFPALLHRLTKQAVGKPF